jgi:isopenicillin N synthase-like dioxygenase
MPYEPVNAAGEIPLPTIDISPFTQPGSSDEARAQVVRELRQACLDHGFFIATGHGVPTSIQQSVLEQARLLFSLPMNEKDALLETRSFGKSHRGYQAIRSERLQEGQAPDLKEVIRSKPPSHRTYSRLHRGSRWAWRSRWIIQTAKRSVC